MALAAPVSLRWSECNRWPRSREPATPEILVKDFQGIVL
jgi:hypothetical protein